MYRWTLILLLLTPVLAIAQFEEPTIGGGTSDSMGVDTDGDGTIDNYLYSTTAGAFHIKKGANITLTVAGDSVTVAGTAGSGTADSLGIDTNGDGTVDNYLYSTVGQIATLIATTGGAISFTVNTDTLKFAIGNQQIKNSHVDSTAVNFIFDDPFKGTSAVPDSELATLEYAQVIAGDSASSIESADITDQTIVRADIDSTVGVTLGDDSFIGNANVPDSQIATKGYADGVGGGSGNPIKADSAGTVTATDSTVFKAGTDIILRPNTTAGWDTIEINIDETAFYPVKNGETPSTNDIMYLDANDSIYFAPAPDSVAKALGDASGNTITTTYAPLSSPTFIGTITVPDFVLYTGGDAGGAYDSTDAPSDGDQLTWNTGGTITWEVAGGGAGEANTASNLGIDADSIFYNKSGIDLRFRRLIGVGTVSIAASGDTALSITGSAHTVLNDSLLGINEGKELIEDSLNEYSLTTAIQALIADSLDEYSLTTAIEALIEDSLNQYSLTTAIKALIADSLDEYSLTTAIMTLIADSLDEYSLTTAIQDSLDIIRDEIRDTTIVIWNDSASVVRSEMPDSAAVIAGDSANVVRAEMPDSASVIAGDTATVLRAEMPDTAAAEISDSASVFRANMGDSSRTAAGDSVAALRDGDTWTGVHDHSDGSIVDVDSIETNIVVVNDTLKIPAKNAPDTDIEGAIAWDANDDAIEVYMGDEGESALIPTYRRITATIVLPDSVQTHAPDLLIFHADALIYPFGIEIDQLSITLDADAAYSMVFEEWSGADPPVYQNDIETVTTGAADSYAEDGTPTDGALDADDRIYLDLPTTDVDFVTVNIIYHVNDGN